MAKEQRDGSVQAELKNTAEEILDEAERVVNTATQQLEETARPVRRSVLRRFPILFLLAVTFGFTATVTGMEQLLIQHEVLQQHPAVVLCVGVLILIATGTVYKKLG